MSLGLLGAFVGGVLVTGVLSRFPGFEDALPFWLTVSTVGYVFSIIVHPYRDCWWCHGTARHTGAVATYARRSCRRCGGSGRAQRLGAWLVGRN